MPPAIQQTKPVKLGRWGEQEEAVQRPQFQVWNQELERSTYGGAQGQLHSCLPLSKPLKYLQHRTHEDLLQVQREREILCESK